ncbi:MAG TPA: prolyl oligopeptidase family serine peptidase [Candidatus Nanopelagicaceae bacterium]|nr:prolyl oligopeptidase family serine peptidase [Candidatus Nanopelagicaceae bacterium]
MSSKSGSAPQTASYIYPSAARDPLVEQIHGREVSDPYRWLERGDSDETRRWQTEENSLWDKELEQLSGRDEWTARVTQLLEAGYVSAPAMRGDFAFFMRRAAGQEHGVLLVNSQGRAERVLIDPMLIDPTGSTTLDAWQPSKEGNLLAYQLSKGGTEEAELFVLDVVSGKIIEGPIDRTRYSPVAWVPGGGAFFYGRRLDPSLIPADEAQFHRRIYLHQVGTPAAADVEIFGAGLDMTNYYDVAVSLDGRWLQISASAGTEPRNDLWIADLSRTSLATPEFVMIQDSNLDAQTSIHFGRDGRVYISTDRDAPRGQICFTSPAELIDLGAKAKWHDFITEDDEAVMEGWSILDGSDLKASLLLVARTRHAISEISIHDLVTGDELGKIAMPGLGSLTGLTERPEGGHEAWFGYTDHVTPPTVYHFDARSGQVTKWADPPGSIVVPTVFSRQVAYKSLDETIVRMSILSLTENPDRPRPTIIYGYGGFGVGLSPGYSAAALAWVEAGGVWVVANLRGGDEEGEDWHRDGMRSEKQNVFDDLHSAAERLISDGWTTASQLAIQGGSNGGLLVGAALTQRPELYAAVVCSAPLLDMVRYESFGLGATWSDEYGSAAIAEEFEWLISYSPYHHVHSGVDYPATLFTVFEGDSRVDLMHARKMCASLQFATASKRPVLIRSESNVGHGGRAVSKAVDVTADGLAFTARWTGLSPTGGRM